MTSLTHARRHGTAFALARHIRWRGHRERLLAFQDRYLRRLVRQATARVPYYRELLDRHGIRPEYIRGAVDLQALPITSKQDLHERPSSDLLAKGVDPDSLLMRRTGGSCGQPLTVRRSEGEERMLNVIRRRTAWYYEFDLTRTTAVVSAPREDYVARSTWTSYVCKWFGLLQWQHVSCLLPVKEIVDELGRIRPGLVGGYPGVLARVASSLQESGRTDVQPLYLLTGGEVRTPAMRDQIAAGFRAPVWDTYGSHEFSRIAWECKETGAYHVADDSVILEILDANDRPVGVGERGEVVATALHSHTMPFIRYRLGDVVTKGSESCACGAPFSTIAAIQGRMVDYFHLPDGRLLHPYQIAGHALRSIEAVSGAPRSERPIPWLREYQYVQERVDRVALYMVPAFSPPVQELLALEQGVRQLLGPSIEFEVIMKPRLETEGNGKFRVYRSLIASAYDTGEAIAVVRVDAASHAPGKVTLPSYDAVPEPLMQREGRHLLRMKRLPELTAAERDGMFTLLASHYDGAVRAQFDIDLNEKEWVVIKTEDHEVVGFTTLMRIGAELDGQAIIAFYSGDTIVRPDRRRAVVTHGVAFLVRQMAAHVAAFPEFRHYYFHVAGTARGYLMVPSLFKRSEPRFDTPLTLESRRILTAFARAKGLQFDAKRSIVRYENPTILRSESDGAGEHAQRNPHLRFYEEQNPGSVLGERLASLVDLSPRNFSDTALRLIESRAPEETPEPAQALTPCR